MQAVSGRQIHKGAAQGKCIVPCDDWGGAKIIRFPQGARRPVDVGYAPTEAAAEKPPAGRNAPPAGGV